MARPDSATGLYWSIRGAVLCAEHARDIDDAQWAAEVWDPIPASSGRVDRARYQCQQCSPFGFAIKPVSAEAHGQRE
jgi:hypothetical protein